MKLIFLIFSIYMIGYSSGSWAALTVHNVGIEKCKSTGGHWGWKQSKTKASGSCIYYYVDGGKVCDDDSSCISNYCKIECASNESCDSSKSGKCWGTTLPVSGCRQHLKDGKVISSSSICSMTEELLIDDFGNPSSKIDHKIEDK